MNSCRWFPSGDELALVPGEAPLARLAELTKEDLYRLGFVCLDAVHHRKMVDQLLARSGLDVQRLRIDMELNSLEAAKCRSGRPGRCLCSRGVDRAGLSAGTIHRPGVICRCGASSS